MSEMDDSLQSWKEEASKTYNQYKSSLEEAYKTIQLQIQLQYNEEKEKIETMHRQTLEILETKHREVLDSARETDLALFDAKRVLQNPNPYVFLREIKELSLQLDSAVERCSKVDCSTDVSDEVLFPVMVTTPQTTIAALPHWKAVTAQLELSSYDFCPEDHSLLLSLRSKTKWGFRYPCAEFDLVLESMYPITCGCCHRKEPYRRVEKKVSMDEAVRLSLVTQARCCRFRAYCFPPSQRAKKLQLSVLDSISQSVIFECPIFLYCDIVTYR
jgi:hypothetical protein